MVVLALIASGCRLERNAEARFVDAVARAEQDSADPYGLHGPRGQQPIEQAVPEPDDSNADSMVVNGKVAETMDAAGYTYVRVTTPRGDVWAAVPQIELHVGDAVTVDGELTMENFESKTLKRTFGKIIFGTIPGQHRFHPELPVTSTAISVA